jgi:hypothetical protein
MIDSIAPGMAAAQPSSVNAPAMSPAKVLGRSGRCPAARVGSKGIEGNLSDAAGPPNVVSIPTSQPQWLPEGPGLTGVNMTIGGWKFKKNRLRRDTPAPWARLTGRSDAPKTRAPGNP